MKILYLTSEDMRKEGGGKTHFFEVAKHLTDLGNELLILLPGYLPCDNKNYRLNIKYVPTFRKSIFAYLFYEFINIFYLSYYISKFKPDVIYSRQCLLDFMHPIIAWLFKVPYVMEKNGIMEDEFRSRGINEFIIKILKLSERVNLHLSRMIICVTDGIKREIFNRYKISENKMVVIPNGVNPKIFRPLNKHDSRRKIGLSDDKFYVGFVGSFVVWQGIDVLIEAAKIIKEKDYKDILYLLVGDGEITNSLKKRVERYTLQSEVIFCGRVAYHNVPIYINACDVVVVPKKLRNESIGLSPLKLYEYLACSKPVIATKIKGLVEVIQEGRCGYICEPDDAEDLADKIILAYSKREFLSQLGKNGRKLVEKRYTWRNTAKKIINVLCTVVNK